MLRTHWRHVYIVIIVVVVSTVVQLISKVDMWEQVLQFSGERSLICPFSCSQCLQEVHRNKVEPVLTSTDYFIDTCKW